jgi:O-antigen ligase
MYGIMQFLGLDIFKLFPYEEFVDAAGNELYGSVSVYFRTTLGNVNIVSAHCSFAVVLFAVLFAVSKSKWQYVYLGASLMCFALSFTTGLSGDAYAVAIFASMVLLIPYWLAERERISKILIILSGWCLVYVCNSVYLSDMKTKYESGEYFAPVDRNFLTRYEHKNITLFIILAAVLLTAGLCLLIFLKAWNTRVMKKTGIILLPAVIICGVIGLEIIGSRLSDNPNNFIWQAREVMHGRFDDDFGSSRGWIWKRAVSVIPNNPVFGTGPDTFLYALGEDLQHEAIERYRVPFDKAHNLFLQITVCMGIPALIAFLIFIGHIFISAAKRAFERPLLLAFGAAALSYLIQSFFCVEVPITTPLLWIALGVMAGEVWMATVGCENIEI